MHIDYELKRSTENFELCHLSINEAIYSD